MGGTLKIILFDVDGVLVEPLAYRVGIKKTLGLLCELIGVEQIQALLPTDSEVARMEASGIHDVWDITNIMFCLLLDAVRMKMQSGNLSVDLSGSSTERKLAAIKSVSIGTIERPSYDATAALVETASTSHPPQIVFGNLSAGLCGQDQINLDWMELYRAFLGGTRDVNESYGTRLFQNIILGAQEFERTYHLPSAYSGESLLRSEDRALLKAKFVQRLNHLLGNDDWRIALYTARPSHPPASQSKRVGYSPEAEYARELAGLTNFPLVGMGMMEWLAEQHNERSEALTKPNSTQAFAALLAATAGSAGAEILQEAYQIDKSSGNYSEATLSIWRDREVTVFVIEDTVSGVKPMIEAVDRLRGMGYWVGVKPLGVAVDAAKRAALEPWCEQVFDTVNEALEYVQVAA